ncbi:ribonuclease HII [Achromobacter xylosoxidans]
MILDPARPIEGLADSKALKPARREALALEIRERALAWFIASASVQEIDSLNILRATMLAMQRAVQGLSVAPQLALVDGNQAPKLGCTVQTVIKGDALVPAISAVRPSWPRPPATRGPAGLHEQYPQYAFDQHKGYGTALHLRLLREHGPCAEHRRSFAPIKAFGAGA